MKIAILGEGTRGDVWPLVALGAQMTARGHEVSLTASEEFRPMAEAAGTRFVAHPASLTAYIATDEGQRLLNRGGVTLVRRFHEFGRSHRRGIEEAFLEAAEGAEALVTNHLTRDRAHCLATALGVPHATMWFFPMLPTGEFSCFLLTSRRLPTTGLRRSTYGLVYRVWRRTIASENRAFADRLGLSPPPRPTLLPLGDPGLLVLNAFSPSLVPKPREWGNNHPVTGFWRLPATVRAAIDEGLPGDLAAWIDAGEPPIFLGFGSMPVLDPERLLATAAEVTRSLGVRAVVSMPHLADDERAAELPDQMRVVGAVDHDLLLTCCAAAVHHGGAGTLAASVRAGLPTMVCSVWADQPFWGLRLESLGAGVHVPFKRLDSAKLEAGLGRLLSDPVRERAAEVGAAVRAEGDGAEAAARLLDEWLPTAEPLPA
jgi:sterol 3beta-glucosyltransferase